MTILAISAFGGESPRTKARDLPPGGAQKNQNLLATSVDFRPLQGTAAVTGPVPPMDTVTLYRNQRQVDGSLITDMAEGWVHSADDLNIVRGQVADDTTERTYYANNDGSAPPRAKNNKGDDVLLGIPRPPKPEVSLLTAARWTREQAQEWKENHLLPGMHAALLSCLSVDQVAARYTTTGAIADATRGTYEGESHAGVTQLLAQSASTAFQFFPTTNGADRLSQRGYFEPWNMMIRVPTEYACAEGIANPQLNGITTNGAVWLGFPALPLWGRLDAEALRAKLASFTSPQGGALWVDNQVQFLLEAFSAMLSPGYYVDATNRRAELDAACLDFAKNGERLIANSRKPAKGASEDQSVFDVRLKSWGDLQSSAVTAMVTASAKAGRISHDIEALYTALHDRLLTVVTDYLANVPLEKTSDNFDGLVVLDDTSLVDTRYYITTYVTAWGEESSPSEPSSKLEVRPNDLVVLAEPSRADVQSQRLITKYRLYRSNQGSSSAQFQLVDERDFGATPTVPTSDLGGMVGVDIPGYGDQDKWRDIVATWQIYRNKNLISLQSPVDAYLDTSQLSIGDTARQSQIIGGVLKYQVTKTWNGGAWVMQSVPALTSILSRACYVDGKYATSLGEVCPTITWTPPPYRFDAAVSPLPRVPTPLGVNPYMRGLTGMPNGIMAGFVDNFVAFCEPYVAYAWPVEYQIPLEFPVVGMCAFGQSLLVGTKANPYIVSGTDSASMSARKINVSQGCVSARSMVAGMGGVFYASPDGYCFASESTVEVVTTALFSNEDWRKLDPASIFAVVHDSVLYFWYAGNGGGCFGLDMVAKKLIRLSMDTNMGDASYRATAAFEDVVTDAVYVTYGGQVRQLFAGNRVLGSWKSGKLTLPQHAPLAWVRVLADFDDGYTVRVNWYGDGKLRRVTLATDTEPRRLPPGRYLEHEVEVISSGRVTSVTLASTTEELKAS